MDSLPSNIDFGPETSPSDSVAVWKERCTRLEAQCAELSQRLDDERAQRRSYQFWFNAYWMITTLFCVLIAIVTLARMLNQLPWRFAE